MLASNSTFEGKPFLFENGSDVKFPEPTIAVVYADFVKDLRIEDAVSKVVKANIKFLIYSEEENHFVSLSLIGALNAHGVQCLKISGDDFDFILMMMNEAEKLTIEVGVEEKTIDICDDGEHSNSILDII